MAKKKTKKKSTKKTAAKKKTTEKESSQKMSVKAQVSEHVDARLTHVHRRLKVAKNKQSGVDIQVEEARLAELESIKDLLT